jgi:hypothetical protein
LIPGTIRAVDFSVAVKTTYFIPADYSFKNIYGSGIQSGARLEVYIKEHWVVWTGADYFTKKGELTFSKEETTFDIIPLDLGLRYYFLDIRIVPYIGGAVQFVLYREVNPIGTVDGSQFGFLGEAGALLGLTDRLFLDLKASYCYCKIQPVSLSANLGGVGISVGLKYRFAIDLGFNKSKPWYEDY